MRESQAAYQTRLPGPLYCDTSALLKLYVREPGSDDFNRTVEGRDDLVVSDLAITEVVSALSRQLRQGSVTRERIHRVLQDIVGRCDGGTYQRVELTREVHRRAEHFLMSLTAIPLRAGDALHLALATWAHAASMASFDVHLRAAAHAVGLVIYPPEVPR